MTTTVVKLEPQNIPAAVQSLKTEFANANLAGYGLQFGTEPYIYVQSASSSTTGSSSMSMYISSTVCQYLPNTCYLTTMKLQAMSQAVDGGLSAGISAPASIQVAIDCGGCL